MEKTCKLCKETINVDVDNINGIACVKNMYYHTQCLLDAAPEKRKRSNHAIYWDTMEADIGIHEENARSTLRNSIGKDMLNSHLLSHYNIISIPNRFWTTVSDISSGLYNKKPCKPVNTLILFRTWEWGQKYLDKIAKNNLKSKRGPISDIERLNYDLSIVLQHVVDYERHLENIKVEAAQREMEKKEKVKIDYSKINRTQPKSEGLGDISDLLDDLF